MKTTIIIVKLYTKCCLLSSRKTLLALLLLVAMISSSHILGLLKKGGAIELSTIGALKRYHRSGGAGRRPQAIAGDLTGDRRP